MDVTAESYITLMDFDLYRDHSERFLLLITQVVTFSLIFFSHHTLFVRAGFSTKRYKEGNSCIILF